MASGGHGTVSGIPNFAPAASLRLWALLTKPDASKEEQAEAARIQAVLSKADVAAVPAGVRGMSESRHISESTSASGRDLLELMLLTESQNMCSTSYGDMARIHEGRCCR